MKRICKQLTVVVPVTRNKTASDKFNETLKKVK